MARKTEKKNWVIYDYEAECFLEHVSDMTLTEAKQYAEDNYVDVELYEFATKAFSRMDWVP